MRADHVDHMAQYNDFWRNIVEVDGKIDRDKVARELADYSHILREYPKVLDEITGGLMTKPNYFASDILAEADAYRERLIREAIEEDRACRDSSAGRPVVEPPPSASIPEDPR